MTCQACGAEMSLEVCGADENWRKFAAAFAKLPCGLQSPALQYIALFRPQKRRLTAARALRIINELNELVAGEYLRTGDGPVRRCPPEVWAAAMMSMAEKDPPLKRPMKNHNYLKKVAWDLAGKGGAETAGETRLVSTETWWDEVLASVKHKILPEAYHQWFEPLILVSKNRVEVTIAVPDAEFKKGFAKNFAEFLEAEIADILGKFMMLNIDVVGMR